MEQSRVKKILKYPWPNHLLLNMCRLATHFWPVTYLCSPKVVVVVVVTKTRSSGLVCVISMTALGYQCSHRFRRSLPCGLARAKEQKVRPKRRERSGREGDRPTKNQTICCNSRAPVSTAPHRCAGHLLATQMPMSSLLTLTCAHTSENMYIRARPV